MKFSKRANLIIFGLMVLVLLSACQDPKVKKQDELNEKRAFEYLETRYGDQEEFEYLGSRYTGGRGRDTFKFNGLNENIYFEVTVSNPYTEDESVHDRYLDFLWDKQFLKLFVPKVQSIFREKTLPEKAFLTNKIDPKELVEDENGYVDLELNSIKNLSDKLGEYGIGFVLQFHIFMDIEDDNLDPLFEEIMIYVDYMKELGIEWSKVSFMVFETEALEDDDLKDYFTREYVRYELSKPLYDKGYDTYRLRNSRGFKVDEVNDIEDLKKFYDIEKRD